MIKVILPVCWRFCRPSQIPSALKSLAPNWALKNYSTKVKKNINVDDTIDEGPIKFSTSKANKHLAKDSRQGGSDTRLKYEGEVIMLCIVTFLIYFCILREENDVDKELDRSLYSRIEGLEELQLKLSLQYNQEKGLDTKAIEMRLQELEQHKKAREGVVQEVQ